MSLTQPDLSLLRRLEIKAMRFFRKQPALGVLLLLCLLATVRYETFFTSENLVNVLRQNSMAGLLALAMMFAIISGGVDLSLGAMLAVGGVVAATLSYYGSLVAVFGAVAVTAILGAGNGILISMGRMQPFIATLVMNMATRGILLAWTEENSVRLAKEATGLRWLGRGWIGPIPIPVLVLLGAFLLAWAVLHYTRFGRHVYAVGDNDEAARLMGLNVNRVRICVFAISGALGGLAGLILAARINVGQPMAGFGWELNAITAVILGCASLRWGHWSAGPTLVGVLLLATLFNMFNLEGTINSYWQFILRGVLLLTVVVMQHRLNKTP